MKPSFFSFKLNISHILDIAIETSYLLLIFLVPVWFAYLFPIFNMFELSKLIIFKILLSFFTIFLIWWLVAGAKIKILFKSLGKFDAINIIKLMWPAVALIIYLLVSLFFSTNLVESFWGSYTRQQGVISYLFYFWWGITFFFYLFSVLVLHGKASLFKKIKRVLLAMIAAGATVSLYGVLQIMNIDFLAWPEPPFLTGRALSTLGQPNFLASFLLFTIPVTFYFILKKISFWSRFLFVLIFVLQLACLFFTSSRGGFLALLAVLGLVALRFLFFSKLSKKIKITVIISSLLFLVVSVGTMEFLIPGRVKSLTDLKSGSLAARVYFFQSASDAILEKPIFGYGLETGEDVFIKYYERDWGLFGNVSSSADRAHNLVLDILLSVGFVGFIFFIFWYYYYFRLGFKGIEGRAEKDLALALTCGSLGYFISLLFSFTIIAGEVYFWLIFSLLLVLHFSNININLQSYSWSKKGKSFGYFIAILLTIFVGLFIGRTYKTALADYYQNSMQAAVYEGNFIWTGVLWQKILELDINPVQTEKASNFLANNLINYASYANWRDETEKELVIKKLRLVLDYLPDNSYRNLLLKAKINSYLGNNELAVYYFSQVAKISPEWPLNYLEWGRHYIRQGDIDDALKYFKLTEINLPDEDSSLINEEHRLAVYNYKYIIYKTLGGAYFKINDYNKALNFYRLAYRYLPSDGVSLKKIADCYYLLGDINKAIEYNIHGAQINPQDHIWPFAVAALYYEVGDIDKAQAYLEKAFFLAPGSDLERLNNLKNQLENN
jgi:putative inorganic carbon (HCO3(-)) transporter